MPNDIYSRNIGVIYFVTDIFHLQNNINPKYYIGSKKTIEAWENEKSYFGSSNSIKDAVHERGNDNFQREIIASVPYYEDYGWVLNVERDIIIDNDAVNSVEFYNGSLPGSSRVFSIENFERRKRKEFTEKEILGFEKLSRIHSLRFENGIRSEKEIAGFVKRSYTITKRKNDGNFTKAEKEAIAKSAERRRKGAFTENELNHYKNFRERLGRKEFTEAEIQGKLSTGEKLKDRKNRGEFTDAELAGNAKRKIRYESRKFTEKELLGYEKISRTRLCRFATMGLTEAEKEKIRIETERKKLGKFTDAELCGFQKRLAKMIGKKKMNDGIANRMISKELVDRYLSEGWVFGWLKLPNSGPNKEEENV